MSFHVDSGARKTLEEEAVAGEPAVGISTGMGRAAGKRLHLGGGGGRKRSRGLLGSIIQDQLHPWIRSPWAMTRRERGREILYKPFT